jgi:hypothetical protein
LANDIGVETSPQHADGSRPTDTARAAGFDRRSASPGTRAAAVWPWWLLRLSVTVQMLLAFVQPVLAGKFLSGDFSMLALHRTNGTFLGFVTIAQIATSLLTWRPGHGPFGLFSACLVLGAATALQLYAGFNHLLGLHIPLGVAIVGLNGWLAVWVWRRGPKIPARGTSGSRA